MTRRLATWLDPILVTGIAVSIVVALTMVLLGNDTVSSLIVGLLVSIVTILLDIIARIERVNDSIFQSADLSHLLSSPYLKDRIRAIAEYFARIRQYHFDHYDWLATVYIEQCESRLRDLANGSIEVTAKGSEEYGFSAVEKAKHSLKATHLGSMAYWETQTGRRFLDANAQAIRRGIKITRVFAFSEAEVGKCEGLLAEQAAAGINVWVVGESKVSSEYMIVDDTVLLEWRTSTTGDYLSERITVDSGTVRWRMADFQHLLSIAQRLSTHSANQ